MSAIHRLTASGDSHRAFFLSLSLISAHWPAGWASVTLSVRLPLSPHEEDITRDGCGFGTLDGILPIKSWRLGFALEPKAHSMLGWRPLPSSRRVLTVCGYFIGCVSLF